MWTVGIVVDTVVVIEWSLVGTGRIRVKQRAADLVVVTMVWVVITLLNVMSFGAR